MGNRGSPYGRGGKPSATTFMQRRAISALSVIRRGCRSPRRGMAMPATSASAIRVGLRTRTPMPIRRAIRCGVPARPSGLRASLFFNGLWRDKVFQSSAQKRGVPVIAGTPRFTFSGKILLERRLLADDGDFRVGNFQPHQAVIAVQQKKNLEVRGGDFQAFVRFAVGAGGSRGLAGDWSARQFLRNEHGTS